MRGAALVIVASLLFTACATTETQTFSSDPVVRPGAKIELGSVSVAPEKSYEIDAAVLMRNAFEAALLDSDIGWDGDPAADRFVLDVVVDDYEPGNAFKRWLLPGYGSTIVRISGQLTDLSTRTVAGELDYERAVHAGGGFTIGAWQSIFNSVANDVVRQLDNRVNKKGFTVKLTPWPARDIEIPVAAAPQNFNFDSVLDSRTERGRIGERKAAFEVSMGSVFFYRDVPAFLQEAVAAELLGAGHQIDGLEGGRPVSVDVVKFWTHTNTTALYWDVIANIEIAVSVGANEVAASSAQSSFSCEETKRTYVWPSLSLVTNVLDNCLVSLMGDIRASPVWSAQ